MIHSLYVIDSGICIYSYRFKKDIQIDEQLLSGFLTAIGQFANETFKADTGLQTIHIQNQKLNFYLDKDQQLLFCAISGIQDNNSLLESILKEIAAEFKIHLGDVLSSKNRASINEYKKFNPVLEFLLKNKVKPRNKKSLVLGVFAGAITLVTTLLVFVVFLSMIISNQTALGVFVVLYLSVSIFFSCVVSGYIAGNPKKGARSGIGFFFLMTFLLMSNVNIFAYFLMIFPFILIVCIAGGYYGGLKRDLKKLYPLESD